MFEALFVVAGAVECIFSFINFIKPSCLFPGIDAAGRVPAKLWNIAAMVLGLLCFMFAWDADSEQGKAKIAVATLTYHAAVAVLTLANVVSDQPVDGPDAPCYPSACTSQQNNIGKGALAIIIHLSLAVSMMAFLIINSPTLSVKIWAIIAPVVVSILASFSAFAERD